jgi:hypothetical protein
LLGISTQTLDLWRIKTWLGRGFPPVHEIIRRAPRHPPEARVAPTLDLLEPAFFGIRAPYPTCSSQAGWRRLGDNLFRLEVRLVQIAGGRRQRPPPRRLLGGLFGGHQLQPRRVFLPGITPLPQIIAPIEKLIHVVAVEFLLPDHHEIPRDDGQVEIHPVDLA